MANPESLSAANDPGSWEPADLMRVGTFASPRSAGDHGLVILAMGLPYWLEDGAGEWSLLVEARHADEVRRELELFDEANRDWPPPPEAVTAARVPVPWLTPLLWAVLVCWVYQWQVLDWRRVVGHGALDGVAIFDRGEWWRPLTALFLHADVAHLIANLVFGVVVFASVIASAGVVRGWLELTLAAVVGNLAPAAVHRANGVVSYGASTAVFAGLGWLTGDAVGGALRRRGTWRSRRVLVPLAAGVVLLAWLGGGGLRTDVVAHAAGFFAGLLIGGGRASFARQP